jgi:glycerol-3-phosphate acyltransferase PlsY
VVTLGGTMLVMLPVAVLVQFVVLLITLLASRYMSLGSLLGSASLLPATIAISAIAPGSVPPAVLAYAVIGPAIVWIAHADNIDRLRHGTERKFDFGMLRGKRAEDA